MKLQFRNYGKSVFQVNAGRFEQFLYYGSSTDTYVYYVIFFISKVGKWSPSQGIVMFPEKPVLWLSQSLETPRDRAGTVENISIRVITVIVRC